MNPNLRGAGGDVGDTPGGSTTSERAVHGVMATFEDNWWRDNYGELEGIPADRSYEYYRPAFHYGWESHERHRGKTWAEAEPELSRGWEQRRGSSGVQWSEAGRAVRHAFERAAQVFQGDRAADAIRDRDRNPRSGNSR